MHRCEASAALSAGSPHMDEVWPATSMARRSIWEKKGFRTVTQQPASYGPGMLWGRLRGCQVKWEAKGRCARQCSLHEAGAAPPASIGTEATSCELKTMKGT